MPSGYTAPIYEGKDITLAEFAATCARGMGAFIHQRDDSNKSVLTYRVPSKYYAKSLAEAKKELEKFLGLSEEHRYAQWSKYYKDSMVRLHEQLAKNAEMSARYDRMIAQVQAVEVPSRIDGFKDFMLSQLEDSKQFDCSNEEWTRKYHTPMEYAEWCDKTLKDLHWNIDYYSEEMQEEQERCEQQREYASLMAQTFGFEVHEPVDTD